MKKNNLRNIFTFLFLLLFSQMVLAANNFSGMFDLFSRIVTIFSNQMFIIIITIILMLLMLYGIFAATLTFIPAFTNSGVGSQGGAIKQLNKQGKLVAIAIAGISTLGILGIGVAQGGFYAMLQRITLILSTFGTIAAWIISSLFGTLVFFLYKNLPLHSGSQGTIPKISQRIGLSILSFGISFWVFGNLMNNSNGQDWGFFFTFIGVVVLLISIFTKSDKENLDELKHMNNISNLEKKAAKNISDSLADVNKKFAESAGKVSEEELNKIKEAGNALTKLMTQFQELMSKTQSENRITPDELVDSEKEISETATETKPLLVDAGMNDKVPIVENVENVAKDIVKNNLEKDANTSSSTEENAKPKSSSIEKEDSVELPSSEKEDKKIEKKGKELAKRILLEKETISDDINRSDDYYNKAIHIKKSISSIDDEEKEFQPQCRTLGNQIALYVSNVGKYITSALTRERVVYRRNHRHEIRTIDFLFRRWDDKNNDISLSISKLEAKKDLVTNNEKIIYAIEILKKDSEVIETAKSHLLELRKFVLGLAVKVEALRNLDHNIDKMLDRINKFSKLLRNPKVKGKSKNKFIPVLDSLLEALINFFENRSSILKEMEQMDEVIKHYDIKLLEIFHHERKFHADLEKEMIIVNEALKNEDIKTKNQNDSVEEKPKGLLAKATAIRAEKNLDNKDKKVNSEIDKLIETEKTNFDKTLKSVEKKEDAIKEEIVPKEFKKKVFRNIFKKVNVKIKRIVQKLKSKLKGRGNKALLALLLIAFSLGLVKSANLGILDRSKNSKKSQQQIERIVQQMPDQIIQQKLERLEREHHIIVPETITEESILELADEVTKVLEENLEPEVLEELSNEAEKKVDVDELISVVSEPVEKIVENQIPEGSSAGEHLEANIEKQVGNEAAAEISKDVDNLSKEVEAGKITPEQEAEIETRLDELAKNYGKFMSTLPNYSDSSTDIGIYRHGNDLVLIVDSGRNNPQQAKTFGNMAATRLITQELQKAGAITQNHASVNLHGSQNIGVFEGPNGNYFSKISIMGDLFDKGTYLPLLQAEEKLIRNSF